MHASINNVFYRIIAINTEIQQFESADQGKNLYFNFNFIFLILILSIVFLTSAQKSDELQKRLDPDEKALIDDSQMPNEKLYLLMDSDVSLQEYFQYPWLTLGITEKEWIGQQKIGISGTDTIIPTKQVTVKQWAVVQNFFLPGLHQFKRHQLLKGYLMSGIALGSIALFVFHNDKNSKNVHGFDYPIYLAFLGGDLLWSSIDIGIQVNEELNKNTMRFSYMLTVPIKSL